MVIHDPDIIFGVTYIRDKRSPVPKSETVSRVMSANKDRNTKPELILRKAIYILDNPSRKAIGGTSRCLGY